MAPDDSLYLRNYQVHPHLTDSDAWFLTNNTPVVYQHRTYAQSIQIREDDMPTDDQLGNIPEELVQTVREDSNVELATDTVENTQNIRVDTNGTVQVREGAIFDPGTAENNINPLATPTPQPELNPRWIDPAPQVAEAPSPLPEEIQEARRRLMNGDIPDKISRVIYEEAVLGLSKDHVIQILWYLFMEGFMYDTYRDYFVKVSSISPMEPEYREPETATVAPPLEREAAITQRDESLVEHMEHHREAVEQERAQRELPSTIDALDERYRLSQEEIMHRVEVDEINTREAGERIRYLEQEYRREREILLNPMHAVQFGNIAAGGTTTFTGTTGV